MAAALSIIVVAGTTWSGHNRRAVVELSRALSRHHRVLFVENPPTALSRLRNRQRLFQPARLRRLSEDLLVLTPPEVLPTGRLPAGRLYRTAMAYNRGRLSAAIQSAVALAGLESPVLLNAWNPTYGLSLLGSRVRRTAYYCYDDIGSATWKSSHGPAAESAVLRAADRVIATSPALLQRCSALNPATSLVPNGVDYAAYRRSGPPHRLTRRSGPILGFVGSIDHRVDIGLLSRLADARPDAHLLIVGRVFPSAGDLTALASRPNVSLPGPVSADEVPAVLRGLSVGLIPFRRTRFTAAVCPLKVYEYLAAGLPVVSTDFAPITDAADVITQAPDAEGFIAGVDAALSGPLPDPDARLAVAEAADWHARAEQLLEAVLGEAA